MKFAVGQKITYNGEPYVVHEIMANVARIKFVGKQKRYERDILTIDMNTMADISRIVPDSMK